MTARFSWNHGVTRGHRPRLQPPAYVVLRFATPSTQERKKRCARAAALFADDFDQNSFLAAAVEFAVEDLLPGTEIQLAICDGNHHFTAHDLALDVRVRVVF